MASPPESGGAAIKPRLAYAANRAIGLAGISILQAHAWTPKLLMVPTGTAADGADAMREMLPGVPVLAGDPAKGLEDAALLTELGIDYLLSVHFPYKFPDALLRAPAIGCLNLHPAWLPFNRGWHTPSWAIIDKTPYGATLHWIDSGIDSGDIAIRHRIEIEPSDTAHRLYQRVLQLEKDLLREAVPLMIEKRLPRVPQGPGGSTHTKRQLQGLQRLDLMRAAPTGEILDRLRALTTNRPEEGAYFEREGLRYYVRVEIEARESPHEP